MLHTMFWYFTHLGLRCFLLKQGLLVGQKCEITHSEGHFVREILVLGIPPS